MIFRRIVLLGVPLVLAIVEWSHPTGQGSTMFDAVLPKADWWLILHILQVPLFALIALAVWFLVSGLQGWAPWMARAASACFAGLIIAYDSVQGIATGVLIRHARGLPVGEQAGYRSAVEVLFSDPLVGNVSVLAILVIAAWAVAVLAAAAALSVSGAPFPVVLILALTILGPHNFPLGTISMAGFFAVAAWLEFANRPSRTEGIATEKIPSRDTEGSDSG